MSEDQFAASLPEPLTPPDSDLRGMKWFPLHHKDLADSSWWNAASDVARSRSVDLWVKAYQNVPAASLPNNDVLLAKWAGFGRDLEAWAKYRAEILAPWVLCSDGLLYHPRLAEVACETWATTERSRERDREKKRRKRQNSGSRGQVHKSPGDNPENPPGETDDVPRGREGGREGHITRQDNTIHSSKDYSPETQLVAVAPKAALSAPAKRKPKINVEVMVIEPEAPKPPKNTKGTRIDPFWTADATDREFAEKIGYSRAEIITLEDAFLDYWKAKAGKDGVKLDWRATWRTWVRNDVKFNGGPNGNGTIASRRPSSPDRGRAQHQDRVGDMLAGAMGALERVRGRDRGGQVDRVESEVED